MFRATVTSLASNVSHRFWNARADDYPNVSLYPDQPWSLTVGEFFALNPTVTEIHIQSEGDVIVAEPIFPTLAEALAFKLTHEGPEFEIEITEVET